MALGFGFNKAKVLSAAEKYVQQGKLHNAITEYEKVVEKDSKDLTVLNTIGDLYARLGETEKAGEYFRRVGDTYASDGFTVKAIAMYKKLTKLNPAAISVVQRLAELYTQQGLYNDARQQYLVLADSYVKNNDLNGATRVFQKMLEIDPDNASLQSKLADLYVKAGKKTEARDIYMRSAQSLYERGSVEQADQALDRMLALDPSNMDALLMRGKIALDAGDGAGAARYLDKVPNIDSRADGLQALMRAYILSNDVANAEGIAHKLVSVHNDLSGVRAFADYLLAAGSSEAALDLYDQYVDRLVVGDTGELIFALQGLTGQVKESPTLLEKLRGVFQKAGANANIPEVNELLAHACVKTGELAKARDLYRELSEIESSNPQHLQNYRQVMARMGEEPIARPMTSSEGAQALYVEEIDAPLPPTQQEYPASLMEKIANVLTDAELFESYNKPQQALAPLEGILAKAPRDVRINQRLLSVYGKLARLQDAARCCDTLKDVYQQANMPTEARKYGAMATRFREHSGVPQPPSAPVVAEMPVMAVAPAAPADEVTADAFSEMPMVPIGADTGEAHEIDLSMEWEAATEAADAAPSAEMPVVAAAGNPADTAEIEVEFDDAHPSAVSDLLEEIKFYLSQSMFDEARTAVKRCEQAAPASFELAELKQQLATAVAGTPVAKAQDFAGVELQDVEMEAPPLSMEADKAGDGSLGDGSSVAEFDFAVEATPMEATLMDAPPTFAVVPPAELMPEMPVIAAAADAPAEFEVAVAPAAEPEAIEEIAVEAPAEAPEMEMAAESPAEEVPVAAMEPASVEEPANAPVVEPEPELAVAQETAEPAPSDDVLADFVLDLEESLGEGFGAAQPAKAAAAVANVPTPTPAPQPVPQIAAVAAVSEIVASSAVVPALSAPVAEPVAESGNTVLADLFAEFKEEVGEASEEAEDPDTHYNLGVAFKEMGLLDEAIGELQKVCKSIDRGTPFTQVMQAYTWLAACFVEKGVPEAAVKWYQKALTIADDSESRTALHYDLAAAFEASGDRPQAIKNFMEVYGTNIDYRDVAERIKTLKS